MTEPFRKGDTVWYESSDPVKARDPRTAKIAGWLGSVNTDTMQALFHYLDASRTERYAMVPLAELRHRELPR